MHLYATDEFYFQWSIMWSNACQNGLMEWIGKMAMDEFLDNGQLCGKMHAKMD
jgi:hypothetical protein